MELDVRTRRIGFFSLLAVAVFAVALALFVTLTAQPNAGTWLLVAVVVLVLALAGELFLLVYGESRGFDEGDEEWYDWEGEAEQGENELLLRCSGCQETFTLHDTGERPLRHACPHCGRSGVLRGESASTASTAQRA